MRRLSLHSVLLVVCFISVSAGAEGDPQKPFLHPLFASDMVLQRDLPDPIWGWAEPGQQVTISFNGKTATATADKDGKWMARIGPFAAGGANVKDGPQEISAAEHPNLRLFTVPKHIAFEPQSGFNRQPRVGDEAKWLVCTPKNVQVGDWGGFSAAGYFFGRDLQEHLKVPIGLIHTSWGGTVAEAWTSAEALKQMPDFRDAVESLQPPQQGREKLTLDQQMERWYAKHDPGSAHGLGWADPSFDDGGWKAMKLPTSWEQAGLPDYDGIVWFRRVVEVPAAWAGKDLRLHLGPIDDRDTTWVNGTKVGGLDVFNAPRDYKVPASAVKGGKLVIAVRVLDTGGTGGIYGHPDQMKLEPAGGGGDAISLAGEWKYKDSAPLSKTGNPPQTMENNPNVPTVLYNGMVSPLVPFAIKGAIWYQGESNASRAMQYRTLLPTMIRDWRGRFGVGEFPFLIVQLAAFGDEMSEPGESQWAELREAQDMTARTVGHSAIAVATDIGEAHDIHPHNKQEVGRRLALDAEDIAYGEGVEHSGPVFKSMETQGSKVILYFDHVGGGLVSHGGGELKGFALAGDDHRFRLANAKIEGDTVFLSSPQVAHPTAVRYAWSDNPEQANLFNKAGLPAPPFRTDRDN
jgi:sialate O-acetylesterase